MEDALPHRPPALFVTRVLEQSDQRATIVGEVPMNHSLVAAGRAPAILAVDLAAQAAGFLSHPAAVSSDGGGRTPRIGYLVSLRGVTLLAPTIAAGCSLKVEVTLESRVGNLLMLSFLVSHEDRELAQGQLGVYSGVASTPPSGHSSRKQNH